MCCSYIDDKLNGRGMSIVVINGKFIITTVVRLERLERVLTV